MLTLEQIASYFPQPLFTTTPQGALVEYLQHELLDSLFKNPASPDRGQLPGLFAVFQWPCR